MTETEYEDVPLGAEGAAFLAARLRDGLRLGRALAGRVEGGRVFARLPRGAAAGGLPSPDRGGIAGVRASASDADLAARIAGYLAGGADRVCLLENALARPADRALARGGSRVLHHGDEVYHLVCAADADAAALALREARTVPEVVGVLSAGGALACAGGDTLSAEALDAVVAGAAEIVVGAFDGEAFLVWRAAA